MKIRNAEISDARSICDIYNKAVLETTATLDIHPRTISEQKKYIEERSGAHIIIVGQILGEVVGFASISPYKNKDGYNSSVENSIYVSESHRGKGIGKQLLTEIIELATKQGFHSIFARIETKQEPSKNLHTKLGFKSIGTEIEVARKFGRWLDITIFQKILE